MNQDRAIEVVKGWRCPHCFMEYETLEDAQECDQQCSTFLATEPASCDWCDHPGEHESPVEGRIFLISCGHYFYGLHEGDSGDAENDGYETIQRLRGVEALPWEYPDVEL